MHLVYPVHPNPNVQAIVDERLRSHPNISLIEPLDYVPFVDLMRQSLRDPDRFRRHPGRRTTSLGKPVLVMREKTERPEAIEAGTVKLVGTDRDRIVRETISLLDCPDEYDLYVRASTIHMAMGHARTANGLKPRSEAIGTPVNPLRRHGHELLEYLIRPSGHL